MNDAPDKTADSVGLDFVVFSVGGWRVAFEARQIRSSSLAPEGKLCNGIEARLGFSPAAPKASAGNSSRQLQAARRKFTALHS